MHTFVKMILAKTEEEKRLAEKEHRDYIKSLASDEEVIRNFLKDCELFDEKQGRNTKNDNITCPTCGYYCLGKGGFGCIDKPNLTGLSKPQPPKEKL